MDNELTAKQAFWLDHIKQAQASGQSYKAYAQQQGLNIKALYNWVVTLRRRGFLEDKPEPSVFVRVATPEDKTAVKASTDPSQPVLVQLPNGIRLQLPSLNQRTLQWLLAL